MMRARRADPLDALSEALAMASRATADIRTARAALQSRRPRAMVDPDVPAVAGRVQPDARTLARAMRVALAIGRQVAARAAGGAPIPADAAALAWLAVDALALASALEPDADGWRAARIAAEAAAETGGRTARAHVVTP